jgi:hypothetical protein
MKTTLSVIMLNVIMLSDVMLIVIMLDVMAPIQLALSLSIPLETMANQAAAFGF